MKIFILICAISGSLLAMDQVPMNGINVTVVSKGKEQNPMLFKLNYTDSIAELKQLVATAQNIPLEQIRLRAIPKTTGLVASDILPDNALVSQVISHYTNRFLLLKKINDNSPLRY